MIDEIEEAKSAKMRSMKMADDDFTIKSKWPHLKKALNWLLKSQLEGAAELMATIVSRRHKEIEMEETRTQEQVKLMLEQVSEREKAEVKKVLFDVCCGENSKLTSHFKDRGGEGIRLYLPKHNVAIDHTIEAAKRVIKILEDEGFTVKIWISIPCSPWCLWQRVNLWTVKGFEGTLNERREESREVMDA